MWSKISYKVLNLSDDLSRIWPNRIEKKIDRSKLNLFFEILKRMRLKSAQTNQQKNSKLEVKNVEIIIFYKIVFTDVNFISLSVITTCELLQLSPELDKRKSLVYPNL